MVRRVSWRLAVNKSHYIQDFRFHLKFLYPVCMWSWLSNVLLTLTGVLDSAGTFIGSGRIDVNWHNGYKRHFETSTTLCSIGSAKLLYCLLSGRPFHLVSCGHISLGQWSLCVLDRKLTLYKIYSLLKVMNVYIERIRLYFDCHICLNSASSKYGQR